MYYISQFHVLLDIRYLSEQKNEGNLCLFTVETVDDLLYESVERHAYQRFPLFSPSKNHVWHCVFASFYKSNYRYNYLSCKYLKGEKLWGCFGLHAKIKKLSTFILRTGLSLFLVGR